MKCQSLLTSNNPGLLTDLLSPFISSSSQPNKPPLSSLQSPNLSHDVKSSSTSRSPVPPKSPGHSRSHSQSLSQSPLRCYSKSLSPTLSHRAINAVIEPSGLFSDGLSSDPQLKNTHSASLGNLVNLWRASSGPDNEPTVKENETLSANYMSSFPSSPRSFDVRTPNSVETRRLSVNSQVCRSLDEGLDHVKTVFDNVRDHRGIISGKLECYNSSTPFPNKSSGAGNTGSLTNLHKNKPLMVVSDSIDFEDKSMSQYEEDETTNLLRSWHEDNPSQFSYTSCGSSELLEEVGIEATENFMQSSAKDQAKVNEIPSTSPKLSLPSAAVVATKTSGPGITSIESKKVVEVPPAPLPKAVNPPVNRYEEKKKKQKTKSRNFWPFSRSNTSDDSSRDTSSASEPLLCGTNDDTNNARLSNATKEEPCTEHQGIQTSALDNPADAVKAESSKNSLEENTPLLNAEKEASDELLKQSLAAMAKEIKCTADLSKLSDLNEVTDRTERLASRPFSFKLGGK